MLSGKISKRIQCQRHDKNKNVATILDGIILPENTKPICTTNFGVDA